MPVPALDLPGTPLYHPAVAKKKRSHPHQTQDSEAGSPFSAFVPALLGVVVGAMGTLVATKSDQPTPPPGSTPSAGSPGSPGSQLDPLQREGFDNLRAQIESQIQGMDPDRIPTEDQDRQFVFRFGKRNRWLLAVGRARPEDTDRWSVALARTEKDPVYGELPDAGLAIDAVFDLPGALGIEGGAFNETGSIAALLTRSRSRARAPGDLYRLVPGEGYARKVDDNVFRFALAPDGDSLVYERAVHPEQDFGERELKIFHASQDTVAVLRSFAYPKEQLGRLGPWGPGGVFLELTIDRYGDGIGPPNTTTFTLDPFNPTNFVPVGGSGVAGSPPTTGG